MSGIAEIMHNLGYKVQGSDTADNANVKRLRKMGIPDRHRPRGGESQRRACRRLFLRGEARQCGVRRRAQLSLPLVRRAEMLAEIMRLKSCVAIAGTNGKTTTTTMIAALLDAGGLDPTVVNGGIINAYGTNARLGAGEWVVVEADESDGTFLRLPATVAVVTNVDPDHLDYLRHLRQDARCLPALRRERAVLRLRRAVPRSSRSAGDGRPHRGSPPRHLWLSARRPMSAR